MSDTLVKVEGVSKKFCRDLKRSLWYGMKDLGNELLGRRHGGKGELRQDEFWAVKDVSFELKRGECLGLIGHNGAGKTTLLRMLNGLIKPDKGRIEICGNVGALIALGAGFNPILTGRENIYVNAAMLGLGKNETNEKIHEIIEFAELGEFIDAPVQSYSSGMQIRLGFAVASSLNPDVLLLDEVLTVGDAAFKYKCYKRMDQLLSRSAVIFVSHDMPQIARICDRTFLMDHGHVKFHGTVPDGVEAYQCLNQRADDESDKLVMAYHPIQSFVISELPDEIDYRAPISFRVTVKSAEFVGRVTMRFDVRNQYGAFSASCAVPSEDYGIEIGAGENIWRMAFVSLPLKPGNYIISMNLADEKGSLIAVCHAIHKIVIRGGYIGIVPECQLFLSEWHLQKEISYI
jgi:ABC-type polysaccharide/polyol phosphate transport system ATPase subunit